jgi:hypothetical protein
MSMKDGIGRMDLVEEWGEKGVNVKEINILSCAGTGIKGG